MISWRCTCGHPSVCVLRSNSEYGKMYIAAFALRLASLSKKWIQNLKLTEKLPQTNTIFPLVKVKYFREDPSTGRFHRICEKPKHSCYRRISIGSQNPAPLRWKYIARSVHFVCKLGYQVETFHLKYLAQDLKQQAIGQLKGHTNYDDSDRDQCVFFICTTHSALSLSLIHI